MPERIRKWFPVLFLSLLGVLSYWLENKVRLSALSEMENAGHSPDVIVKNLAMTKFGLEGEPRESLSANELLHYPDNSTKLVAPRLLLVSPGQADVHVSSDWAMLSENGDDIYLHDNVLVKRDAYGGKSRMDMTTDFLHLNPDEHVGDTNMPVRLKDARMDVHAVGMTFNDQTRVVKLLSHVHADYEK
ncbi:MAG TPA: LPS export ABC transporter periplasmic protein LptC [Burkholderiales bacterium]|nr:LPS export ABC transporter periplasmic protein LptC [Burkholderiales bacterium]